MILINFEYMIFYSPHKWRTWTRQVFHQLLLGQCRHSLRLGFCSTRQQLRCSTRSRLERAIFFYTGTTCGACDKYEVCCRRRRSVIVRNKDLCYLGTINIIISITGIISIIIRRRGRGGED